MKRQRWNERYATDAATWPDEPCPVVVAAAEAIAADAAAPGDGSEGARAAGSVAAAPDATRAAGTRPAGDASPTAAGSGSTARRAVDLACGTGRNARYLARHGWDVTAVDFAEEGIAYGRRVAEEAGLTITWQVADLLTWQPQGAPYDLVCICYLHLPWSEMETVIRSAWSAVAPGGRMAIVGHDLTNLEHGTGGPQHPDVLYVPGQITALLREISGKAVHIVREEQSRYEVDHGEAAGTGAEQIDCVVVAQRPE